MNYQNDPYLYDHAFYQKRWPLLLGVLFFGAIAGLGAYELFFKGVYSTLAFWKMIFMFVSGLAFVVIGLIGIFLAPKRISLGLNKNGLYVKGSGVVPWSQVKGFEIGKFGFGNTKQKCIFVSLHDPDSFFSENKIPWWRSNRRMTKDRVVVVGNTVPLKLKKLLPLLQDYHRDVLQNR